MAIVEMLVYLCVALCVLGAARKAYKYFNMPLHLRWELYPVAHEAGKASYGGSYFEEGDWWTKPIKPSLMGELSGMMSEMIFVKGLYEENRKLWNKSFPFHFGLYMLIGFTGLIVFGALLEVAGVRMVGSDRSVIAALIQGLTYLMGIPGMLMVLYGSAALFLNRMSDPDLEDYTYLSHYLNLAFIFAATLTAFFAWLFSDLNFEMLRGFVGGLLPFKEMPPTGFLVSAEVVLAALLMAYIPFTNMSHPIAKYYMWHKVRWDDEPNFPGGEIERKIQGYLGMEVTWAGKHLKGEGKRTWAAIATEEWKSK